MLQTVVNWLTFDIQNLIVEVWWCVAALWLALLLIAVFDVVASSLRIWEKTIWLVLIVLLPFAGLAAYCIACLLRAEYYMIDFLFKKRPAQEKRPTANTR